MSISIPRLFAAILSLGVGALTIVVVSAIYLSNAIVDTGFGGVSPADAALLDQVVAILPLAAVFGAVITAGGVGLLAGAPVARPAVAAASFVAFAASLAGIVALSLGHDPFVTSTHGRTTDGIGMLLAVAVVHLAILASLAFDRPSGRRAAQPAA